MWLPWRYYKIFTIKSSIGFTLSTLFVAVVVFIILLTFALQTKQYSNNLHFLDSDKEVNQGYKMECLELSKHRPEQNLLKYYLKNDVNKGNEGVTQEGMRVQKAGNETLHQQSSSSQLKRLRVTLEQYKSGLPTGNPLIDDYRKNNLEERGEMGKPVVLSADEKLRAAKAMLDYNVNTVASDVTPLNRLVPDSRINKCDELQYNTQHLPSASIIIPFYDEWPSLLLRTIYSIVNRSPRHLVEEIILIDDASTLEQLKEPLEKYIKEHFPEGLVRIIRVPERFGLIRARIRGSQEANGDVLIYFDSHMEVNIDWLPPLLTEIAKDKTVVAMATLDYVQSDTLEYRYNHNYLTRYGWNWRMVFFETFFRKDQIGPDPRNPREGITMVGTAFALDKKYYLHLGGFDDAMSVWGGENLEMSWRVWLCGGRLLHVPCSRVGHVARAQPYSFPGGREQVEHFNYKRAVSVWMGNYSRYVYNIFPDMKTLDVGDISSRLDIKSRLGCKDFKWYLDNVWPELGIFDENVKHWGRVRQDINFFSGSLLESKAP